jgi:hypothetical protein
VEFVPSSAKTTTGIKIVVVARHGPAVIREVEVYDATVTNTVSFLISDLVTDAGITSQEVAASKLYRNNLTAQIGDDHLKHIREVADGAAWEAFGNTDGEFVARPFRFDPNEPNITYAEGECNITSITKDPSGEGIFNYIVVISEQPTITIRAEAKDDAIGSPTSIQRLGKRVKVVEDATILTQKAADLRAQLELIQNTKWKAPVSFTMAVANPCHEAWDVIRVVNSNTKTDGVYLLKSFTLDMTPESFIMSGQAIPI